MLNAVLSLVKNDVERQAAWARNEVKRQGRAVALTTAFAVGGATAALGTVVVGLMALYTWAEMEYGPLPALGIVALATGITAALMFTLAFMRGEDRGASQPRVQSADPAALKAALSADVSAQSAALMDTLKRSSLGSAVSAGEDVLKKGEEVVRLATGHMREGSKTSLVFTLGAAAVIGLIVGRRL